MADLSVSITEWQTGTITLPPSDVQYIAELTSRYHAPILTLTPQGGDVYTARASHFVGLLSLPTGRTLEIRPKTPIGNLVYMLNAVNDLGAFLPKLVSADTFTALFGILIAQFTRELEALLRHGLLRGFITRDEQSTIIRGKLNLSETLRQSPATSLRHHSQSPDATSDILENQLLAFTCSYLLDLLPLSSHSSLSPTQTRLLQSLSARLQGVSISAAHISRDDLRRVQFTRLNEHYRPALALAELLLLDQSPVSTGTIAQHPSFLVDMNRLFERYTTVLLKHTMVEVQPSYNLDRDAQLTIRPDIVMRPPHGVPVPIDAKYKTVLHQEDVYQALTYCHALHTDRAVLVYPNADPAQRFVIDSQGGMKIVIVVLGLDLTGDVTMMHNSATRLVDAIHRVVNGEHI